MARQNHRRGAEYEVQTVRDSWNARHKVTKLLEQGWEIVHAKKGFLGAASTFVLRRYKPQHMEKG